MPRNLYNKVKNAIDKFSNGKNGRNAIVRGQTKLPDAAARTFLGTSILNGLKWFVFYIILVFLLTSGNGAIKTLPKIDDFAKYDIVAPSTIKLIDEAKTQSIRDEFIKNVQDRYKRDEEILPAIIKNIDEIFEFIKNSKIENQKQRMSDEQIEQQIMNVRISFNAFRAALDTTPETLEKVKTSLHKIFKSIMASDIPQSKIGMAKNDAEQKIRMTPFDEKIQQMMIDIFEQNIKANYVYDKEATAAERNKLLADAIPVERHIKAGQIIVRRGEIIQKEHIDILKMFNIDEPHSYFAYSLISAALIAFFSVIVIVIYIMQNHEDLLKQDSLLTMMALIVFSVLVIAKLIDFMSPDKVHNLLNVSHEMPFFSPFIVPVPAAAILIALLIDSKLAYIVNIITVILVDLILGHSNLNFLIINILSGTIAVLNVKNVNHRTDITKAGIMVSFTNIFLIISYAIFEYNATNSNYHSSLMNDIVWGFFNGFISAIFAIGLLPYLESLFKVSSSMRLLELSDLNQPLLRRLLLEAPGTYHHSIIVGNLAEAAAKDIEADALLCRVAAYYHDIGKLKRPLFFIENQSHSTNIHDNIKPNLSAKSIMSHTKDGYEIGLEYQLPREILDIILQHHGTNLITYFYSKALEKIEKGMKDEQLEGEYRYLGPKPQCKEAAIILLADAVEAAFRTLSKPSPSAVESLVKKIKSERFNDGQFDECDITLKDLEKVSLTLVRIINGMYHSRIEYPDMDKDKNVKNRPPAQPASETKPEPPAAAERKLSIEGTPAAAGEQIKVNEVILSGEKSQNENNDN